MVVGVIFHLTVYLVNVRSIVDFYRLLQNYKPTRHSTPISKMSSASMGKLDCFTHVSAYQWLQVDATCIVPAHSRADLP